MNYEAMDTRTRAASITATILLLLTITAIMNYVSPLLEPVNINPV